MKLNIFLIAAKIFSKGLMYWETRKTVTGYKFSKILAFV